MRSTSHWHCRAFNTNALVGLLSSSLCCGEPNRIRSFWLELSHRERLVEEFSSHRASSRKAHLSRAIYFLRSHNVVVHGALHPGFSCGWNVTSEFSRVTAFGESFVRNEACLRVLKLLPMIEDEALVSLVDKCCSQSCVAALYDSLHLNGLLDRTLRRHSKPTALQKQSMIFAMLGEMHWFALRTKATDRTHNNALFPPSDVLILHSLCAHSVESIVVELLVKQFEGSLRAVEARWKNFGCSLPSQLLLKPRTISRHSLSEFPVPRPTTIPQQQNFGVACLADEPKAGFSSTVAMPHSVKGATHQVLPRRFRDHRDSMQLLPCAIRSTKEHFPFCSERRTELLKLHERSW